MTACGKTDSAPVIKYVNLMILGAITKGEAELSIRSSSSLAPLGEMMKESHPEGFLHSDLPAPPFSAISNRLKIMSGLNPMSYKTPVSGTIDLRAGGEDYTVATEFDDTLDDPMFGITITKAVRETEK